MTTYTETLLFYLKDEREKCILKQQWCCAAASLSATDVLYKYK